MYLIYIYILTASLFLISYGNLTLWLGLPLLLLSLGGLLFQFKEYIKAGVQFNHLKKRGKLKWIGKFSLIEGLNLVPNQDIFLGLTRRDSLSLFTLTKEHQIDLSQIEGLLLISGGDIVKSSDDRLRLLVNRESQASVFNNIRNLIMDASHLKKEKFLFISLKPSQDFYNKRLNQDLIILILTFDHNSFYKFAKSPEIRNKLKIYNEKLENIERN